MYQFYPSLFISWRWRNLFVFDATTFAADLHLRKLNRRKIASCPAHFFPLRFLSLSYFIFVKIKKKKNRQRLGRSEERVALREREGEREKKKIKKKKKEKKK